MNQFTPQGYVLKRPGPADTAVLYGLLDVFAEAFEDPQTYSTARPDEQWLARLLGSDTFIALAVLQEERVVAGLATALIAELQTIAAECGAWVVYVQADYEDAPAVALYSGLGRREEVLHFDLPVKKKSRAR